MLVEIDKVPGKSCFREGGGRMAAVETFLQSGFRCAEIGTEGEENPRRVYNGILMAVRRRYRGEVSVHWRHGHVYLMRLKEEKEA